MPTLPAADRPIEGLPVAGKYIVCENAPSSFLPLFYPYGAISSPS
jgi:hypothetical protein